MSLLDRHEEESQPEDDRDEEAIRHTESARSEQISPAGDLTQEESIARSATESTSREREQEVWYGVRRRYVIHRPRALQFKYQKTVIHAADVLGEVGDSEEKPELHVESHGSGGGSSRSRRIPESIDRQRERLDLFIDLIWVGVIGNMSEVFSSLLFSENSSAGLAALVFLLVFIPSWRIWNSLREFMNNYYMDDVLQRIFIFWILALSVLYGNNLAYLVDDIDRVKKVVIIIYLCIRGSFDVIEILYSVWIPWLRRLAALQFCFRVPTLGLWIAAIFLSEFRAVGPLWVALAGEYIFPLILESHLADRLLPDGYRKAVDPHHFASRMMNFFIIIVGEGVLQLIKGGPLGFGLQSAAGESVLALSIYFLLTFIYFSRDSSQRYLPAVRHSGKRTIMWVFWHMPLFSSFLTLTAGIMFIIRTTTPAPGNTTTEAISRDALPSLLDDAVWTIAVSLAVIMLATTGLALLDVPLDPPGTLRVDNRYFRLAGRMIYIVIILCLPASNISPITFLAVASSMVNVTILWEYSAGLERGGAFLEPQGLTPMISRERKSQRQRSKD